MYRYHTKCGRRVLNPVNGSISYPSHAICGNTTTRFSETQHASAGRDVEQHLQNVDVLEVVLHAQRGKGATVDFASC